MKTSEMRENFPEFSDEEFRVYKMEVDTLLYEGKITWEERKNVLEKGKSLLAILDEKGL